MNYKILEKRAKILLKCYIGTHHAELDWFYLQNRAMQLFIRFFLFKCTRNVKKYYTDVLIRLLKAPILSHFQQLITHRYTDLLHHTDVMTLKRSVEFYKSHFTK